MLLREKNKEGICQHDFVCQHPMHQRYPSKKHVLVCDEHKHINEGKELLEKYKVRCISRNLNLPSFSGDIKLSFHAHGYLSNIKKRNKTASVYDDIVDDKGVYLLQVVKVNNQRFNIFYVNGCSDFIVRPSAVKLMGSHAIQEYVGPVKLGGVGDTQTESEHGIYCVKIPLLNGNIDTLSGVFLDKITSTFPVYPLGKVGRVIQDASVAAGNVQILPKLSRSVGRDVDLMIGIKYLRYHPKMIFQLPSGLVNYESVFINAKFNKYTLSDRF